MNIENFLKNHRAHVVQVMEKLVEKLPGLTAGIISTVDGHTVAHFSRKKSEDPARISAMCSSLFALSETLTSELQYNHCQHITIQSATGPIALVRIPDASQALVITAAANPKTPLGALLSWVNEASHQIAEKIDLKENV